MVCKQRSECGFQLTWTPYPCNAIFLYECYKSLTNGPFYVILHCITSKRPCIRRGHYNTCNRTVTILISCSYYTYSLDCWLECLNFNHSFIIITCTTHWTKMKNATILAIWRTNSMAQHSSSEASEHCFIHILIITG